MESKKEKGEENYIKVSCVMLAKDGGIVPLRLLLSNLLIAVQQGRREREGE